MMANITKYEVYTQTQAQYAGVERTDDEIREEAVGKLIAQTMLAKLNKTAIPAPQLAWYERLWQALKAFLKPINSTEVRNVISEFERVADIILNEEASELGTLGTIGVEQELWGKPVKYELTTEQIVNRSALLEKLKNPTIVRDLLAKKGYREISTGREIAHRLTDVIKAFYRKIYHRSDLTDSQNELIRNKGTLLHKFLEILVMQKAEGYAVTMRNMIDQAKAELKTHPDFVSYTDDFYSITSEQFSELNAGADAMVREVNRREAEIAKAQGYTEEQIANNKPTYFAEVLLYDSKEDMATSVDLLVVHSNGMVSNFDWKSQVFKMHQGTVISETGWVKREGYNQQLSLQQRILRRNYGVTDFAMSRVVPLNMQLNYVPKGLPHAGEPKEAGFKTLEMWNHGDRNYLDQLPTDEERPLIQTLRKTMDVLINKRKELKKRAIKDSRNVRLKNELKILDQQIRQLQTRNNIEAVLDELTRLVNEFNRRSVIPEGLTDAQLNDIRASIELYEDFMANIMAITREIGDPDLKQKAWNTLGILNEFNTDFKNYVNGKLQADTNVKLDKATKPPSFVARMFNRLSQFDNPILQRLGELVRQTENATREAVNALIDRIRVENDKLKEWASSNGLSIFEAYQKLYNKTTGQLYGRVSSKYYEDLAEAKKNNDDVWLDKHTQVEMVDLGGGDVGWAYTGRAKKRFDKQRKLVEDDTKYQYSGLPDADKIIAAEMDKWDKQYNISRYSGALYNVGNRFIMPKIEDETYYTDEWKYIIANKPLHDFYIFLTTVNQELADITGQEIDEKFVANIQESIMSAAIHHGVSSLGMMKDLIAQSITTRQNDAILGAYDEDLGIRNLAIPLLFLDELKEPISEAQRKEIEAEAETKPDGTFKNEEEKQEYIQKRITGKEYENGRKLKSYDLARSLVLFAESAYSYKFLTEIKPTVELLRYQLNSPLTERLYVDAQGKTKTNPFSDKVATVLGIPKEELEVFDQFVNLYLYGQKIQSGDYQFEFGGRTFNTAKIMVRFMDFVSARALGLRPVLAFANFAGAKMNMAMLAAEGIFFTRSQKHTAEKMFVTRDPMYAAFTKFFEIHAHDMTLEKANKLSASILTDWFTYENVFILHRIGDKQVDNDLLLSMAQNYGIKNGKIIKLSDLATTDDQRSLLERATLDKDGLKIEGLEAKEFQKFRTMVRTQASAVKGSIPADDMNLVNTNLLLRAFMQFRNWVPGTAAPRFKGFHYNTVMDRHDVGRFKVQFGEFAAKGFLPKLAAFKNMLGEVIWLHNKPNSEQSDYYYQKYLDEQLITEEELSKEQFIALRTAKLWYGC
jgi:hypothetical protein